MKRPANRFRQRRAAVCRSRRGILRYSVRSRRTQGCIGPEDQGVTLPGNAPGDTDAASCDRKCVRRQGVVHRLVESDSDGRTRVDESGTVSRRAGIHLRCNGGKRPLTTRPQKFTPAISNRPGKCDGVASGWRQPCRRVKLPGRGSQPGSIAGETRRDREPPAARIAGRNVDARQWHHGVIEGNRNQPGRRHRPSSVEG